MESIVYGICIAICGFVIGYINGYNKGSKDMKNIYTDVYGHKEYT